LGAIEYCSYGVRGSKGFALIGVRTVLPRLAPNLLLITKHASRVNPTIYYEKDILSTFIYSKYMSTEYICDALLEGEGGCGASVAPRRCGSRTRALNRGGASPVLRERANTGGDPSLRRRSATVLPRLAPPCRSRLPEVVVAGARLRLVTHPCRSPRAVGRSGPIRRPDWVRSSGDRDDRSSRGSLARGSPGSCAVERAVIRMGWVSNGVTGQGSRSLVGAS
jgi:hypothetical protein